MWDHDDSAVADYRLEFGNKWLSVDDESLGPPEPSPEDPIFPARELRGARVTQRVMDCEDRRVARGQRQQARVVVLVSVHDLRAPLTERSPYREHPGNGSHRSHAARDDEHLDALAPETLDPLVSLVFRPPELEGVGATKHPDLMTVLSQRSGLLRAVLEEKIADDQDPHQGLRPSEPVENSP
jgi:hypothetical protein